MATILLVDDSPTIRRMVRAALAMVPGATFAEAGTGLEAIEALAISRVELMVLDLNMPDMHGLDVLAFVRSHESYRHLPVIVLTTRGDQDARDAAQRAGATAFLTKPFSPTLLASQVRALLDGASPS
jgi:two-component system, chemotaxis family, chemotaxis protein CheY